MHWRAAGSQGSCAVSKRKKLQKWTGIGDDDKFRVNVQADAEVFPNAPGGFISCAFGCVYASSNSLVNKLEIMCEPSMLAGWTSCQDLWIGKAMLIAD